MLRPNIFHINQYEMTLKTQICHQYKGFHPERTRRGALGFIFDSAGQNGSSL